MLRLPYGSAKALIAHFEHEGLVLPAWPGRERMLHPRYLRMHVRVVAASVRTVYIRRVAETALFFFEMYEEKNSGDTRAINLIKPNSSVDFAELRQIFLTEWYRSEHMSLTDAALSFHRWLQGRDLAPKDNDGIETAIRTEFLVHERHPFFAYDENARRDRAFVRLARYYRQMLSEGMSQHTRVPDFFIPVGFIPHGRSHAGIGHREHVVPCAILRETAIRYFQEERSLDDVVKMLKKWLVIVRIRKDERDLLDKGDAPLKHRMPPDWNEEIGCIYARLHEKGIAFDSPVKRPCCC